MPSPAHPTQLGRYEIREEIGRGMMGVVYRARDPLLGREVALKTVHLVFAVSDVEKELFQRRFENEARVAALLSHPNIVVVHDVGRDPETDTLYIAFEHLEGRTVAEVMADGQPLEWRRAAGIGARVAEALHYAHAKGVVHRDVKPANIMLLASGEPKVMDFGVAKVPTAQLTAVGEFLGTPSYMSPEQAAAGHVDGRSDVFALGSVLYLMLTGRRAFDGASATAVLRQLADADPPAPTLLNPALPPAFDDILRRALRKRPEERYRDARQLAEDLDAVSEGRAPLWATQTAPAAPAPAPAPADETIDLTDPASRGDEAPRWSRREKALLAVAAVSFLALLISTRPQRPIGPAMDPSPTAGPVAAAAPASPVVTATPVAAPSRLTVTLDHPFRDGRVRVYVDDALAHEGRLVGEPKRKLLLFREHQGRERETLELPPGSHVVRVEVTSDRFRASRAVRGLFTSGRAQHLTARVGGAVKRELSLAWAEP
jgi:tRNA A-37 threonylcarbamoyl transferase component Bud32